jgi:hypothetical protein
MKCKQLMIQQSSRGYAELSVLVGSFAGDQVFRY